MITIRQLVFNRPLKRSCAMSPRKYSDFLFIYFFYIEWNISKSMLSGSLNYQSDVGTELVAAPNLADPTRKTDKLMNYWEHGGR